MQNSSLTSNHSESDDSALSKPKVAHTVIGTQDLPDAVKDLYSIAEINTCNDAFVILLHSFMLEVGFIPKDFPESERLKLLPKNWHEKGLYSIAYCHVTCPEVSCSMTCFPLSQQLSVFGTVTDVHTSLEPPNICLQIGCYVNNNNIGSSDPAKIFLNIKELSQSFKDKFAYPLLSVMQDASGFGPTFGLCAAMEDVKMQILSYLPVGGLVAMSCVNKEFHELCNSTSLWKKLCMEDFPKDVDNGEEANKDWKKLYKEKYLKQKQQQQQRFFLPRRTNFCGTMENWIPLLWRPPPEFGPDFPFPFGGPDMRSPFPDLQPEARPHHMIHPPPFPYYPLLKKSYF